jgi:hypothetical protein
MIYPRESPKNIGFSNPQMHLAFDSMADFTDLPGLDEAAPSSTAFCIDTSDAYMLRKDTGEWGLL